MGWAAPTTDDVMSEFTPQEIATINNIMQGGANVNNRLISILGRTVSEIRGYVKSGTYEVDKTSFSTVPHSLMTDAIAITRWRFLISAPLLKQLQTQDRKDAMLESIKKLQAVASQNFTPDDPTSSTTQTAGMWNSENKLIMRTHPVTPPSQQQGLTTFPFNPYANPNAPQDN